MGHHGTDPAILFLRYGKAMASVQTIVRFL